MPSQEPGLGSTPPQFLSQLLPLLRAREWVKEATARLWAIGLGEMRPTAVVAAITPFVAAGVALLVALHPLVPIRPVPPTRPTRTRRRPMSRRHASTQTFVAVRESTSCIVDGVETANRVGGPRHLDLDGSATMVLVGQPSRLRRLCGRPPPPRRRSAAATAPSASRSGRSPPRAPAARRREICGVAPYHLRAARTAGEAILFEGRAKRWYLVGRVGGGGRDWSCGAAVRTLMA